MDKADIRKDILSRTVTFTCKYDIKATQFTLSVLAMHNTSLHNNLPQLPRTSWGIFINLTFEIQEFKFKEESSNTISAQISSKAGLFNMLSALAQAEIILCISTEVGNNYSWWDLSSIYSFSALSDRGAWGELKKTCHDIWSINDDDEECQLNTGTFTPTCTRSSRHSYLFCENGIRSRFLRLIFNHCVLGDTLRGYIRPAVGPQH